MRIFNITFLFIYLGLILGALPVAIIVFLDEANNTTRLMGAIFAIFIGIASVTFSWLRSYVQEQMTYQRIIIAGQLSILAALFSVMGGVFKYLIVNHIPITSSTYWMLKWLYQLSFGFSYFSGLAAFAIIIYVAISRLRYYNKPAV